VANRKKEEAPEGRGGYKSLTPHLTYTRVTHKKCGSIFSSVWETGNAAWCRRREAWYSFEYSAEHNALRPFGLLLLK